MVIKIPPVFGHQGHLEVAASHGFACIFSMICILFLIQQLDFLYECYTSTKSFFFNPITCTLLLLSFPDKLTFTEIRTLGEKQKPQTLPALQIPCEGFMHLNEEVGRDSHHEPWLVFVHLFRVPRECWDQRVCTLFHDAVAGVLSL